MTAQMQEAEPPAEKRKLHVRTIVLVVLAALATWFAVNNWRSVYIWPLGEHTITLVIGISFVLGAGVGWLLHSIIAPARRLR
jgi:hypothetical protein